MLLRRAAQLLEATPAEVSRSYLHLAGGRSLGWPAHPVNQQVTASTSSCEPVQAVQYAPPVLETVDGSDHRLDRAVFGLGGRGDVAGQRLNTSRRLSPVRTTRSSPSPSVQRARRRGR